MGVAGCHTLEVSKRLQVVLAEQEMADRQERLTVAEWVRRALREARKQGSSRERDAKLKAVRRDAEFSVPTADMEAMLSEVEQGCAG
jgi:hypothetical protein